MRVILYTIGFTCLFASVISAFVAAKKDKYSPLIVSSVLLGTAIYLLWSLGK